MKKLRKMKAKAKIKKWNIEVKNHFDKELIKYKG